MDILHLQEKYIDKHLQPLFNSHGYKKTPNKSEFRQMGRQGLKSVCFSFSRNTESQLISLQLGIRFHLVESLVNQFLEETTKEQPEKQTIQICLNRRYGLETRAYAPNSEKSLDQGCQEIATFFQKKGFRFLDAGSRLRRVDALINRNPHQPCPYIKNPTHRCFKGIVIARILHRNDFNRLAKFYEQSLNSNWAPRERIINFRRLVHFLRCFSFN